MKTDFTLTSRGHAIKTDPAHFGELRSSLALLGDSVALHERLNEDGYLYLPGFLSQERVMAARAEILTKLASVGEIDLSRPLLDAIHSGNSQRSQLADLKTFKTDLRSGPALRALCQDGEIIEFYEQFLGGAVRPYDFLWLRTAQIGFGTGCHIDWVYMGRGTPNLFTTWFPIGDVPRHEGSLMILEGSHRVTRQLETYAGLDVDRDAAGSAARRYPVGWFSTNPVEVQEQLGGRWLTTDFKAGDALIFTMFTMHCSLDNQSPENRIRLSADTRYQLASEPIDERWVGLNPPGHTRAFELQTVG